jgi:heme/copper-type cytochrome/quinol oxidase subunit 2
MKNVKRIVSYILIGLVLIFTIIAILGIWGLIDIDLQKIMLNTLYSLLVVFAASAVILFIFTVMIRDEEKKTQG